MRVQYGCLNSFIVAMVTFEELFWIMSSHVRAHSDFLHGLLKRVLQLGVLGNLRLQWDNHSGVDKPARLSFSCSLDLVLNERRE